MSKVLMWPKRPANLRSVQACAQPSDTGMEGIYRQYTLLLLRRYCRLSVDLGRLPSVLGREFFRAKVTSYKMHTFEDAVVFVHDMERCIEGLGEEERRMIAGIIFMQYSQAEYARLLGISRATVVRRYHAMLDRLTEVLLKNGLIAQADLARSRRRASVRTMPAPSSAGREMQVERADAQDGLLPKKPSGSCQEDWAAAVNAIASKESKYTN